MLFDVQAALAEILASPAATPATVATNGPSVATVATVAAYQAAVSGSAAVPSPSAPPPSRGDLRQIGHAAPAHSHDDATPDAILHLSRYAPKANPDGRPVRALPTHPATCALCGRTEWTVAMTDMRGRALHVSCWQAEGGKA